MIRIILACLAVAAGFLILQTVKKGWKSCKPVLAVFSIIYVFGLFYCTLFSRTPSGDNAVNFVPFYSFTRSLRHPVRVSSFFSFAFSGKWDCIFTTTKPIETAILNVVLFMPMGYILPGWSGQKKYPWIKIAAYSLLCSLFIETVQLATGLGWFDVDDLLCNLSGALLGCMLYKKVQSKAARGEKTNE